MIKSQDLKKYHLPDGPGVYFFKKKKNILYVGKATSIKDRVKSYFSSDLIQTRGPLIVDMVFQAEKIDYIETNSVLEALILEANLIKKYQPKYNTKEKDDKSFNYIVITREDFPRVMIERGKDLFQHEGQKKAQVQVLGFPRSEARPDHSPDQFSGLLQEMFGPFTDGAALKIALKIIRKIFPFRDKCEPLSGRSCFNRQLGLCPGVCDGTINKKDYGKIIKKIVLLLSGKIKSLKNKLNREMKEFSKIQRFEDAKKIRDQIYALEHIQDVALIKGDEAGQKKAQVQVLGSPLLLRNKYRPDHSPDQFSDRPYRIEAYDVAHLSGTNNVGVMVVMENGELKKSDYRKFIIRNSKGNDIGALKEVLERRLKHPEWPRADLIVVDGGIAQMNAIKVVLEHNRPRHQDDTPSSTNEGDRSKLIATVIAVTKDDKHKPKAIIGDENIINKYKKEILLINNEAHRFAITFHRQKRNITL